MEIYIDKDNFVKAVQDNEEYFIGEAKNGNLYLDDDRISECIQFPLSPDNLREIANKIESIS